ncbi:carboxylating nicotinate-nucleotide diphosphorylase [Candidatus Gracilibacteria bacterium]|nr:carboxylating nicotinate-nucleotide diphosphorylase [Candidatus Gracilibacteria bacterium]
MHQHRKLKTHHYPLLLSPSNKRYRACIDRYLKGFLIDDNFQRDVTARSLFTKPTLATARIIAKQKGILAGMEEVTAVIKTIPGINIKKALKDGSELNSNAVLCELTGDVRLILAVERMVLNALGRLSGIATYTHFLAEKLKRHFPDAPPLLASTRKTLWGMLDKRACVVGGGVTHRVTLEDAVIIKHPHIRASGLTISQAIESVARRAQNTYFFEVEVTTGAEAFEALDCMKKLWFQKIIRVPMTIMLDNFAPHHMAVTVKKIRSILKLSPTSFPLYIEASGGITEKNLISYAKTGVDIISMGALTHSAPFFDVSLRIN